MVKCKQSLEVLQCMSGLTTNFSLQACGEHRQSGILEQGFMASPDIPGGAVIGTATDALVNAAESVQLSEEELQAATAIGFDNKMLLHFEVSLGIE